MTIYHRKAIELKYLGYTYKEISRDLEGKISEGVLKKQFAHEGMLYFPYLEYEAERNKHKSEEASMLFNRECVVAAEAIVNIFHRAVENGNDRLAVKLAEKILDRAGLIVPKKIEMGEEKPLREMTDDEFYQAQYLDKGLDPVTGLSIRGQAWLTEEERLDQLIQDAKRLWSKYKVFEKNSNSPIT